MLGFKDTNPCSGPETGGQGQPLKTESEDIYSHPEGCSCAGMTELAELEARLCSLERR